MMTIAQAARNLAKRVAWDVSLFIAVLFAILATIFLAWNTYFRVESGVRAISPQLENFLKLGDTFQLKVQLLSLSSGGIVDLVALTMPDGNFFAGGSDHERGEQGLISPPNHAISLKWIDGSVQLVRSFEIPFQSTQKAYLAVAKKVHLELFLMVLLLQVTVFFLTRHWMYRRLVLSFATDLTNPISNLASSISSFKGYDDLISSTSLRESLRYKELNEMLDSFLKLLSRLQMEESLRVKAEKDAMLSEVASQVAHDIRSPLTALNMLIKCSPEIPEADRNIFKSATQRINDIANSLLTKSKLAYAASAGDAKSTATQTMISGLVDTVISEKRVQYRNLTNLEIDTELTQASGTFAEVNPIDLARVLSNLVNNSVEAMDNRQGKITVRTTNETDHVRISIQDNGNGIPAEILSLLGRERVSYGKSGVESGVGLGVLHARKTIESFGGKLEIQSEPGKGTTVSVILPKCAAPNWFAEGLAIPENAVVVTVDDDKSIHYAWQNRLKESAKNGSISLVSHDSLADFEQWLKKSRPAKMLCLIDYEFVGDKQTGLDLIERLNLRETSVVVSSRYDDAAIQKRVECIGAKMLPKNLLSQVPIAYARSLS
jgi:signal transduction histidine kinase